MQDFLSRCFYEGLTVEQAKARYFDWYGKQISDRSVKVAKAIIKKNLGRDWS